MPDRFDKSTTSLDEATDLGSASVFISEPPSSSASLTAAHPHGPAGPAPLELAAAPARASALLRVLPPH